MNVADSIQAIFLDRDGIITPRLGLGEYFLTEEQIRISPDTLNILGHFVARTPLFIVTNQQCVGKRLISEQATRELHLHIVRMLEEFGIHITDSRLCFHLASDGCDCRKPKPGMILDLCEFYKLNPQKSVMIGDAESDAQAGLTAGCGLSILVDVFQESVFQRPDGVWVVPDLRAAFDLCFHPV